MNSKNVDVRMKEKKSDFQFNCGNKKIKNKNNNVYFKRY